MEMLAVQDVKEYQTTQKENVIERIQNKRITGTFDHLATDKLQKTRCAGWDTKVLDRQD